LLTLMSLFDTTFWSTTTCTDLDPDTIRFSHSKIYDRFSCGRCVHMCLYEFGGSDPAILLLLETTWCVMIVHWCLLLKTLETDLGRHRERVAQSRTAAQYHCRGYR
jgi:hypothetical protein